MQLIDARDMFTKMRKSLGEKRKEVSQADIDDIVRTYGAFEETTADAENDDKQVGCKIFTNESFGFLRITVERPLKLRFDITSERLDALAENAKFAKLSEAEQEAVVEYLRPLAEHELGPTADYEALRESVHMAFNKNGIRKKTIEKAVVDELTVRDADAPFVADKKDNPEPDLSLIHI